MDKGEAVRMRLSTGEKGMFAVIGLCIFSWFFGSSHKPDPTQCDIVPETGLIEQLASVPFEDPKPATSPSDKKPKIEILVFVSKNCPPCERWKRCEMQKFLDAGWSVGIVDDHPFPVTPRFEITKDGKPIEKVGYLTFEDAKGLVK